MTISAPNFAGIRLAANFQNVALELRSARLYKFTLPFTYPINFKQVTLHQREGLILILTDSAGHVGLGEISPLPGFSRDTLETAVYKTSMLVERLLNFGELRSHNFSRREVIWQKKSIPSVAHFGVEIALLSLLANAHRLSLGTLLYGHSSTKIPVNGLIQSSLSDWVPEADYLVSEGYRTLKIKVGRINPTLEARGIQEIRQYLGPDITIRLDANRSWDLDTALNFGHAVAEAMIEYIEEPLKNPADLPRFYDGCGVPFAFDETLHQIIDPTISFKTYTGLKAFVLKPTLIGCTSRLIALVNQALQQNILPVISSSYESDVGLAVLAQLAAAINGGEVAEGLSTRTALAAGTSKSPSIIRDGWLPVRTLTVDDLDLAHCDLLYQSP